MKVLKRVTTLMLAMVMAFMMVESVSAETYPWTSVKTPGNTGCMVRDVKIPAYTGKMTFKVTTLSGNCSYLLGKVVSTYGSKYYINNSSKSVMITKVNGEQSFYMKFVGFNILTEQYMYLRCSVEHNASIGETVYASGIIYN